MRAKPAFIQFLRGKLTGFFPQRKLDSSPLIERTAALRQSLMGLDPLDLAARTGADYVSGQDGKRKFSFELWGRPVQLALPDHDLSYLDSGQALPDALQALVYYYFTIADGSSCENRWISFSELPNGRFYDQAFRSYTSMALSRAFGEDPATLETAALAKGGIAWKMPGYSIGDLAFRFQALPRSPMLVACWFGDEDFPPSFQLIFDASASHYLTTDGCAILGSMLTQRLISARGANAKTN
jgi:hypothetical protein